jgi:hypothetical protein
VKEYCKTGYIRKKKLRLAIQKSADGEMNSRFKIFLRMIKYQNAPKSRTVDWEASGNGGPPVSEDAS